MCQQLQVNISLSEGSVVNCFIVLYYKKVKRKVLISLKLDAFASFFFGLKASIMWLCSQGDSSVDSGGVLRVMLAGKWVNYSFVFGR